MKFWKPALKVGISLALIALMVHAFQLRDIGRYFARVDAATVAAVYDFDAAAGGQSQAALQRPADDAGGAEAV